MIEQELAILLTNPVGVVCVMMLVFAVSAYIILRGVASWIIAVEGKPLIEIRRNDPEIDQEEKKKLKQEKPVKVEI